MTRDYPNGLQGSTDVGVHSIRVLSLCTGGFGLDLGVELAIPNARTVCCVEHEASAISYLATCMEAGCVAPAPIWTDIATFDGEPWRDKVHLVVAGYPCTPFSTAGRRKGADDPRHLWPHVARVIGECEPAVVFLENVAGHLRLGLREVIGELHALGYRTAAGLFTAAEVGAIHIRERLFIYGANPTGERLSQPRNDWGDSGDCAEGEPWETTDALDALARGAVPVVCGDHDGVAVGRAERLRVLGNGVVPLAAAHAFCSLEDELWRIA